MKPIHFLFVLFLGLSGCIIEVNLEPPYVNVENIETYETKELVKEVWSNGQLIYEEYINHTWLSMDFYNSGGLRAENVYAEIVFYRGSREIKTITIEMPDIRAGETYNYELETGFNSILDYTEYTVDVFWE